MHDRYPIMRDRYLTTKYAKWAKILRSLMYRFYWRIFCNYWICTRKHHFKAKNTTFSFFNTSLKTPQIMSESTIWHVESILWQNRLYEGKRAFSEIRRISRVFLALKVVKKIFFTYFNLFFPFFCKKSEIFDFF